jgi:hypothetical protein
MILNPTQAVAIDLQAWHYWWPWLPISLTLTGRLRWLYVVERRRIYRDDGRLYFWMRDEFRDVRGKS